MKRFTNSIARYAYNAVVSHKSSLTALVPICVAALAQFVQTAPQNHTAVRGLQFVLALVAALKLGQHDPGAPSLNPGVVDDTIRPRDPRTGRTLGGFAVASLALAALAMTGCDKQERAIATNLDRIASAVRDARDVRDELYAQQVIDKDAAYKLTLGLQKVNDTAIVFRQRAVAFKAGGGVTPEGKADLQKLAGEISSAVNDLVSNGTVGIKDAQAKGRVLAITSSINQVVQSLIAAVREIKAPKATPTTSTVLLASNDPPIQQSGASPLAILPFLLMSINKLMAWVRDEAKRRNLTTDELLEEAGVQLDANQIALLEDLQRYAPDKSDAA